VGPVVDELLLKPLPLLVELSSPQRLGGRTWSTSKRFLESASLQLGNEMSMIRQMCVVKLG